jgi:hypothetical protein
MKKTVFLISGMLLFLFIQAQKVESIYFNLYTDSLKKGFFNYINVDGKTVDGQWIPMDSTQVRFSANTGYFKGNDLFIDSAYKGDTITVKAVLKSNPAIWKEVIIHIRKRGFDEPLKTNEEILHELKKGKKPKQSSA